jgi:calcium permeable stress-gated cation channel
VAGVPSVTRVELFTQSAYFAFQVVQVFLITTLTAAAADAFFDIVKDPLSAQTLLAKNLPSASNFYLSYILIQCLAGGGLQLIQLFDLLRHIILPRLSEIPRTHHRVWYRLRQPRWGKEFPVFANMGVIGESPSHWNGLAR